MTEMSIAAIAKRLETQDNAGTAHPVFLVQQRERIYGVEQDWQDGVCILDEEGEELELITLPEHRFVGYVDHWVVVQSFFTREAAQLYIDENAHNLTNPRIYVDSAHQNKEWQAIVRYLKANEGGCLYAGPGRGDCESTVGLPGESIPGQHDGEDDTVDVYGKPNGWCWHCWLMHQRAQLQGEVEKLKVELQEGKP